jgi:hypothetical protein
MTVEKALTACTYSTEFFYNFGSLSSQWGVHSLQQQQRCSLRGGFNVEQRNEGTKELVLL